MAPEQAQVIALQALGWLVGQEPICDAFLGASGASVDDLRARAVEADFQAAILDFITMDDAWVMAFCDAHGLAYDQPLRARYALPGAQQVHWT
jgi:hypothetical protein